MAQKNVKEFRLDVGGAVIGIVCPTAEYAASFSDYFGVPNSDKEPDLTLNLNFVFHDNEIEIPESLFTTKIVSGGSFDIAHGIVRGEAGTGNNEIRLSIKIGLTHGQASRVFEQLLYQAFYSICKIRQRYSLLIHCSGVIHRDRGYLFVGPSGSGKSTIASMSEHYTVLNDEICILDFNNGSITLQGSPFNGYYKNKKAGAAPLQSIFLIRHGKNHTISPIKISEAVPLLAKEIVPPVALQEELNPKVFIRMLDEADLLFHSTRIFRLEFLPDNGFWKNIDAL
jgi:hypothetical protein